jgi:hypothetical protein
MKRTLIFSRQYEVIVDFPDGCSDEMYDALADKARDLVIDGDPSINVGELQYGGESEEDPGEDAEAAVSGADL